MKYQDKITIVEVGPRDGFQNHKIFIQSNIKQQIIDAIINSGIKTIEFTSFVNPKVMPQMADAKDIAKETINKHPGIRAIALVPNLRGAMDACNVGVKDLTYVISASEQHNLKNVNRTRTESLIELKTIMDEFPEIKLKLSLATVFGCPYEGKISEKKIMEIVEPAIAFGIKEFTLCDTIGVANPRQVNEMTKLFISKFKNTELVFSLHLHNTRGMGLANTIAAMDGGFSIFETSIGGMGGCPFAPGAAGNTSTEDLINMAHSVGVKTGIDLDKYLLAVKLVKDNIIKNLNSNMATACKYNSLDE